MNLPADVAGGIVRALGAYLRSAPVTDVPKELRRFRSFRPATLTQHRDRLLAALDDPELRAAVLEWLDDVRPKLPSTDKRNLRLVLERPEGWSDRLATAAARTPDKAATPAKATVERERDRARAARDELKRARARARAEIQGVEARAAELVAELTRVRAALGDAHDAARAARAAAESARTELERERRRARREVAAARGERDRHKAAERAARRELTAATRARDRLQRRIERLESAAAGPPAAPTPRAAPADRTRRPLPVPKGRLPDDPQTLEEWLGRRGAHLVVDGYNAARVEGAFGELDLAGQRERLIRELTGLAARLRVPTTVVFDGAEVGPAARRRRRGAVAVEYSTAAETADDHVVRLLERLPSSPVVVVTNDRELQARAAALGATIATSDQLMGLIR